MKSQENLISRPPIVVVLGHVDHGKTSLLDYIRKTKIVEKEAGGITQHIGAYEIEFKGKKITFIDTPGHEAFSKIRSRGAKAADIAILVIASDEGVKPQTEESLVHIKESQIPFIVALTKIDKENAQPEKVKRELSERGVYLEGWGGDVPWVEVSSKTGQGIDELLDLILLMAEMEGLKANPNKNGEGIIIESFLDSKRGPTVTAIITNGTLKIKDEIFAEGVYGKVKLMENFLGKPIEKATFSMPIRIIGFENVPPVGGILISGEIKEELKEKEKTIVRRNKLLGEINSNIRIPLIIKTDVVGSGEALEELINKIGLLKNWVFNLIVNETGDLSDGDLKLADLKGTLILLFRVKRKPEVVNFLINNPNLIVLEGEVIYDLEKKIIEIVEERFIEKPKEEILGKLEVLKIFNPIKGNQLIGGKVIEGKVINKNKFYLIQNGERVAEGRLLNLQKNKIDVNEVELNNECGLLVECGKDIKEGDILEFFRKI